MSILLQLIFINFLCVISLKIIMSKGMALESLGVFFEKKVENGSKIYDAFICPWCMGTLQSISAHVFAFGLGILPFEINSHLFFRWPLIIMGASFLSGISWTFYLYLSEKTEYFYSLNNKDEQK